MFCCQAAIMSLSSTGAVGIILSGKAEDCECYFCTDKQIKNRLFSKILKNLSGIEN
ncbi:hypothetical protein Abci_018_241 [Acetobacter cibinongensis]|uniref:Uncharacterized protein n=1 Tax=Acetobacter cibinongensis TaxID=146475 RepID=A0A0D6N7A1_9PROT|nr:hypothetical protein Abci_018_241 [Acetobacter cibinongensis]